MGLCASKPKTIEGIRYWLTVCDGTMGALHGEYWCILEIYVPEYGIFFNKEAVGTSDSPRNRATWSIAGEATATETIMLDHDLVNRIRTVGVLERERTFASIPQHLWETTLKKPVRPF